MTDSLFDQKEQKQEVPTIDESQTYLDKLVGPNAKFKDPEALAKGKWYADAMIEIKNRQYDQLRNDYMLVKQELDSRAKFEDLLTQLDNKKPTSEVPQITRETPEVKTDNAPRYSQDDIESIVNRRIQATKAADKEQGNFNTVMARLEERYGSNYHNVLLEQTNSLGLTAEDVNALARKSPEAFFRTMGLEQRQPQQSQTPPRSSVNFAPTSAPKKTWSYYQEMLKKDPKLYYDPKITQEMVDSAASLGDAFQDGDFRKYGDSY